MKTHLKSPVKTMNFTNRFLVGLVIALGLSLTAFEYTTIGYEEILILEDPGKLGDGYILPPLRFRLEEVKKPKVAEKKSEKIKIVDNTSPIETKNEVKIEDTAPEVIEFKPEDYGMFPEVLSDEPEPPIYFAEFFAHYDNCAGLESAELYQCTLQDIMNRIKQNFDIPEELKTERGSLSADMSFLVNTEGKISQIKVLRSNHPAMGRAATKAIEKLPKMNPATQKGKAVNLTFRVPLKLQISG